jgi:hypothetical protein
MDETRHGGDEVNKEDETVMDDAQGSSTATLNEQTQVDGMADNTLQCCPTSYHNCAQAPT